MKRHEFLKGLGILGAGAMLPATRAFADGNSSAKATASCTLIPTETEGPFPLDLSTTNSATYFRRDVREDRSGAKLNLTMRIYGVDNCTPMTNVRVNIWHCDKNGLYSGYFNTMNTGSTAATASMTWLRGYQMTDAYGEVQFTTIFPGWYSGRTMHIHFQVYVSSSYKAVSQMTCDATQKNQVYADNASLYTKGADPQAIATDNIFSDGYTYQMFTLTKNSDGSYNAYMEVSVRGSGTGNNGTPTGIAHHEPETGGQFTLGQNFPNPHTGFTTIPFTLINTSNVKVDIYDLQARKVASIPAGTLGAGSHKIDVDFGALGIASGSYLYQLEVSNSKGAFRQVKMMTAAR